MDPSTHTRAGLPQSLCPCPTSTPPAVFCSSHFKLLITHGTCLAKPEWGLETLANKVKRTDKDCFQNKSGQREPRARKRQKEGAPRESGPGHSPRPGAPGLQKRRRCLGRERSKSRSSAHTRRGGGLGLGRLGGPGELAGERGQPGCTGARAVSPGESVCPTLRLPGRPRTRSRKRAAEWKGGCEQGGNPTRPAREQARSPPEPA